MTAPRTSDHAPAVEGSGRSGGTDPAPVGLWASLAVLGRRWPCVVIGVLVTALGVVGVLNTVPVTYSATGSLLLNVPDAPEASDGGTTVPVNPILGTRAFVGDLLVTVMSDPAIEDRVAARGGTGTYDTTLGIGDAALVLIATGGATPEEAMQTWQAVADETAAALLRLQEEKNAPSTQLATVSPITVPHAATAESGSRTRALAATVILGFGFTLLLVYGIESLSQHRRLRRQRGATFSQERDDVAATPGFTEEVAVPRRRVAPGSGEVRDSTGVPDSTDVPEATHVPESSDGPERAAAPEHRVGGPSESTSSARTTSSGGLDAHLRAAMEERATRSARADV